MALDWDKTWKDAKKFFEDTTKKKKPNAKVGSLFFKHASGIESKIKAAQGAFNTAENANPITQKHIDEFKKTVAAFSKDADNYVKVLEGAVTKEISDAGEKTVYSKGCKYLEKQLQAIVGAMENQFGWLDGKLKKLSLAENMAANLIKTVINCAQKCQAAAAKVKTKPEKDVFESELYTPARDLSQQLGNIPVLRKKGHVFPDKYDDQTAQALYDVIRPYGDERLKKKLPEGATKEVILTELKKFTTAVKSAEAYAKK